MKTITTPANVLVGEHMRQMARKIEMFQPLITALKKASDGRGPTIQDMENTIARDLLCTIADNAPMKEVYAALAAVCAIKSSGDVKDALQAVRDQSE